MSRDFVKCKKCNRYGWTDTHKCYPFYMYYPEYYGDVWELVYGTSMEEVIETIAIKVNVDDPEFDSDLFETPIVVRDQDGKMKAFNCTAELDINYSVSDEDLPDNIPEFEA